ncbi:MAG TPA: hypothetical protein VFH66_06675 [Mycobacteriales bacterium]|nr:hypothetical protein [Mycobacteriales bacterium]
MGSGARVGGVCGAGAGVELLVTGASVVGVVVDGAVLVVGLVVVVVVLLSTVEALLTTVAVLALVSGFGCGFAFSVVPCSTGCGTTSTLWAAGCGWTGAG